MKAAAGSTYTPPACTGIFADVPCPSQFANWIEDLYHRGITAGCTVSPLQYCPNSNVSNTQMAIFLLRSKEGASYQPPACSASPFLDVSCTTTGSAAWIVEAGRRQIVVSCAPGYFCPDTPLTRAQMAVLLARGFDLPVTTDPNTSRTIQLAYTQGLLTGVSDDVTTYGTLSYHPNLLVSQIAHGNGVTETQGNDPNQMRRPSSLAAAGAYASWSSGAYGYDGAGNIKTIGTSSYAYDKVNRLVSATLYDGPTGGGTQKQQSYTFDAFGNLTNIAGTIGRATPTSAQTNRLNGTGTVYDAAGNLTNWNGAVYQYDAFNQLIHMTSGAEDWVYLYTADDERVWSYNIPGNSSRWALRDLGGKVLREYLNDGGRWSAGTDYIYRDGLLLAAETPAGRRHFHLDHLGTPRLITRASGYPAGYHVYYPFGEEATAFNQDTERMKFTGHERDLASPAGAEDDLDYMHARHCSPVTGRFNSADPSPASSDPRLPQSWNRYTYSINNPVAVVDRDGKVWDYVFDIAGIGYDIFNIRNDGATLSNVGILGLDVVLAVVPFVPTIGAVKLGIKGIDAARAAARIGENFAKERAFEQAAIKALDAVKNTAKISVEGLGKSIPDIIGKGITEIKSGAEVSFTRQLQVQATVAKERGVPFNLIVSPETKRISAQLFEIVQRSGGQILSFDPATGLFRVLTRK